MSFNLDDYVPVQERINQFWEDFPQGRITTEMIFPSEGFMREGSPPLSGDDIFSHVVIIARVWKQRVGDESEWHGKPDATGHAHEIRGDRGVNRTSWVENCETSAIGRALANMGYATSQEDRPSREEMAKVNRLAGEESSGGYAPYRQPTIRPEERKQPGERKKWDGSQAMTNPDGPPTDRQRDFLANLAMAAGYKLEGSDGQAMLDEDAINGVAMSEHGKPWKELTKQETSSMIELLKNQAQARKEQTR